MSLGLLLVCLMHKFVTPYAAPFDVLHLKYISCLYFYTHCLEEFYRAWYNVLEEVQNNELATGFKFEKLHVVINITIYVTAFVVNLTIFSGRRSLVAIVGSSHTRIQALRRQNQRRQEHPLLPA